MMMDRKPCIVLAAGGTGGHVFPAQALAGELLERGLEPVLFSDRRGDVFGERVQVRRILGGAIAGQGPWHRARSFGALGVGLLQSWWGIKRLSPRAVVGFGGYASVPTVLASWLCGVPAVLHEQNAVLGRANRALIGRATRVAVSFDAVGAVPEPLKERLVRTGMPVRPAFVRARDRIFRAPEPGEPIRLLVLGGSQGARVFSEILPAAIDRLQARLRTRLHVTQQCRPEDLAGVEEAYRRTGINAELATFFNDVPQRMAAAHLLISRSGASTVAEITTMGCPSILVPYPFATDDHQTANARAVEAAGGCWLMPQDTLTAESMAHGLEVILSNPQALVLAAQATREAASERATARLADVVLEAADVTPSQPPLLSGRLAA